MGYYNSSFVHFTGKKKKAGGHRKKKARTKRCHKNKYQKFLNIEAR